MEKVVGIRFKPVGKIYHFSPGEIELAVGDGVIAETVRGIEYGKVATAIAEIEPKKLKEPLKPVLRRASADDERVVEKNLARKDDALKIVREKILRHKLNMKPVDAEFTFDGNKVIIYFTSEGRVDFRELVKELASVFHMRIELRQIGIRDQSKMLGGLGPCGKPCCCSHYLPDFKHVSIKMAKVQMLSLTPSRISGLCNRLMCCLEYENDHYSESFRKMPKIGSEIETPDGRATVVSNNLLKLKTRVRLEKKDGSFEFPEYDLADIQARHTMAEDIDDNAGEDVKELLD